MIDGAPRGLVRRAATSISPPRGPREPRGPAAAPREDGMEDDHG